MKLFKSLLIAPAALGLMSPLAVSASETNLNDISNYSDVETIDFANSFGKGDSNEKQLLAGGEGLVDRDSYSHDGGFSDTTTLDGKAIFTMGALDYDDTTVTHSEAVQAYYSYTMNLNTSFTGDDNLYVRIKTGNSGDWTTSKTYGGYLSSSKGNGDSLKVDKIWYEFPVGERNTVWVGPKIENYYMHGTTPSIYKPVTKQFTLGGNGNAYGASTDTGAGWAYKADNGFAISSNIGTKSSSSCAATTDPCGSKTSSNSYVNSGLLTDETKTSWATQVGYTKPRYSASAIINVKYNGWSDSYYKAGDINGDATSTDSYTAIGLRGWWRPENTGTATPSVSVGYDTTEYDASAGQENADAWFVGLNWQDIFTPDDRIGVAFGQPTKNENSTVDPFAYEVYYSYQPNDSVTITPTIFGGTDRNGTVAGDVTGAVIETTFKF